MKKKLIKIVFGVLLFTDQKHGPQEMHLQHGAGEKKKKKMDRQNGEVFQRAKEERLLLKILKNRRHSWIGHTARHNEFVVNNLEGAISGKKGRGNTWTAVLKASRQKHRS